MFVSLYARRGELYYFETLPRGSRAPGVVPSDRRRLNPQTASRRQRVQIDPIAVAAVRRGCAWGAYSLPLANPASERAHQRRPVESLLNGLERLAPRLGHVHRQDRDGAEGQEAVEEVGPVGGVGEEYGRCESDEPVCELFPPWSVQHPSKKTRVK